MAENTRTNFVWDTFMKNPEARRGMEKAGFMSYAAPYAVPAASPQLTESKPPRR
jgi:hypothetical protein